MLFTTNTTLYPTTAHLAEPVVHHLACRRQLARPDRPLRWVAVGMHCHICFRMVQRQREVVDFIKKMFVRMLYFLEPRGHCWGLNYLAVTKYFRPQHCPRGDAFFVQIDADMRDFCDVIH